MSELAMLRNHPQDGLLFRFRKEDGSCWEIAGEHYFPPTGETLRRELGSQVEDKKRLGQLREHYLEWLKSPRPAA